MTTLPTKRTNHDTERHYFEQFRNAYVLPPGAICYADKPDVLVKGTRTTGIEITNFYLELGGEEGSEQRQRPRRYEVVSEAHRLYRAADAVAVPARRRPRGFPLPISLSSCGTAGDLSRNTALRERQGK